jgi:hypothetical protein
MMEKRNSGRLEEWKNVTIRPPIAIGATMEEWNDGKME